jgi:hypothetical protein
MGIYHNTVETVIVDVIEEPLPGAARGKSRIAVHAPASALFAKVAACVFSILVPIGEPIR